MINEIITTRYICKYKNSNKFLSSLLLLYYHTGLYPGLLATLYSSNIPLTGMKVWLTALLR